MTTRRAINLIALACLPSIALAHPIAAQKAQEPPPSEVGTIIVAHGSDSAWNGRVEQVARTAHTGGPIAVAYLMGEHASEHRFQDVVKKLETEGARKIVVVPMLVSSHSGHYEQIRWLAGKTDSLDETMMHHLHMAGISRPQNPVPMTVTSALDDAPEMAHVLVRRAKALATSPSNQALFLVGHGPNDPEAYTIWMRDLRVIGDSVKAAGGFRDVRVGVVRDDAPPAVRTEAVHAIREIIQLQRELTGRSVLVVPVLISAGALSEKRVPRDLAGLDIVYGQEPLLPDPEIARWVELQVKRATR